MPKNNIQKNGYTLIEVVISLFIIGVMLLVYSAASNTLILNRDAKHQQIANRIAASELEDLRGMPFASLPASGPFSHPLLSSLPSGEAILSISDDYDKLKQVTVTVSWQEPGSQNIHQVNLTTYIGEQGL